MQKTNLNVVYGDTTYPGFEFENLPLPVALVAAQQQIEQAADQARSAVLGIRCAPSRTSWPRMRRRPSGRLAMQARCR